MIYVLCYFFFKIIFIEVCITDIFVVLLVCCVSSKVYLWIVYSCLYVASDSIT